MSQQHLMSHTSRKLHLDLAHPPLVQSHVRPSWTVLDFHVEQKEMCRVKTKWSPNPGGNVSSFSSWWLNQRHLKNMLVKIGSFPQIGVKIKNV